MSNGTQTNVKVQLIPQTGNPPIYQSRSRELNYDSLQHLAKFIKNPFGPQLLYLSRPTHHW
jgi:hypothetical protein